MYCCHTEANPCQLFDFLSRFPTRNSIVESVVSNKASLDSLFPPGKFFQAKYAAQALRMKLEEQLRSVSSLGQTPRLPRTDND